MGTLKSASITVDPQILKVDMERQRGGPWAPQQQVL